MSASSIAGKRLERHEFRERERRPNGQLRPKPADLLGVIYLVVDPDVCGGPCISYAMLDKLSHSLRSLRHVMPDRAVCVYTFTFDGTEHPSLLTAIHPFGVTIKHLGRLPAHTRDSSMSALQNLKHDILMCKIDVVAFHPTAAVFVDVDTEWVRPLPDYGLPAALHIKESYSLSGAVRSLEHVWSTIGRPSPPPDHCMWNSGLIHIPLADKASVVQIARDLVRDLKKQPGKHRLDHVLDEQLALSYAMQQCYGDHIVAGAQFVKHLWVAIHRGEYYWQSGAEKPAAVALASPASQ